jgi:hypothetical protein
LGIDGRTAATDQRKSKRQKAKMVFHSCKVPEPIIDFGSDICPDNSERLPIADCRIADQRLMNRTSRIGNSQLTTAPAPALPYASHTMESVKLYRFPKNNLNH